jgi:hypothetical protein
MPLPRTKSKGRSETTTRRTLTDIDILVVKRGVHMIEVRKVGFVLLVLMHKLLLAESLQ